MQLVIKRKKFYYLLTILTLGAAAEVLKGQGVIVSQTPANNKFDRVAFGGPTVKTSKT